ncbi:uncharacterized protein LOC123309959 isoform X2 [Coccinella septempunctata]|nr:uncharacterized protein LOC123309959 isoform X2 [Coccinella septempunctata]
MAGVPENRGKRGLVSSLGYGYDSSLGLSALHLPLSSSVLSAPTVIGSHLPYTSSVLSAPAISTLSAPTVIKTVHSAPIVKTVVSQPQILSYASAPSLGLASSLDLHSLSYGSSLPSVYSSGLLKSYNLGGLPVTSHINDLHAW